MKIFVRPHIFLFLLLSPFILDAQTFVDILPAKDNTIFSESGSKSNGLGELFAGRTSGKESTEIRRALLQFSLSTVPVNVIIDSVVFRITVLWGQKY